MKCDQLCSCLSTFVIKQTLASNMEGQFVASCYQERKKNSLGII
jgi:hypothetical protein